MARDQLEVVAKPAAGMSLVKWAVHLEAVAVVRSEAVKMVLAAVRTEAVVLVALGLNAV